MDIKLLVIGISATIAIYLIIKYITKKRKKTKKYRFRRTKHFLHRPSKCYSCEKQIIQTHGVASVNLAQPTKCFDCETKKGNFLNRSLDTSMGGYGKFFN